MTVYVYILKCADGTHYTGITNNLQRRMREHRDGKSKSTRHKRPCSLLFVTETVSYYEARSREVYIKRYGAARFLNHPSAVINKKHLINGTSNALGNRLRH